jgi:hypothetical protein
VAPQLKTQRGEHYGDVLKRLFRGRQNGAAPATPPSSVGPTGEIAFNPSPFRIAQGPRVAGL